MLGKVITGPLFNEPMRVETVQSNGVSNWTVGLVGVNSERFRKVTVTAEDLLRLTVLENPLGRQGIHNPIRPAKLKHHSHRPRFLPFRGESTKREWEHRFTTTWPNERGRLEPRQDHGEA